MIAGGETASVKELLEWPFSEKLERCIMAPDVSTVIQMIGSSQTLLCCCYSQIKFNPISK